MNSISLDWFAFFIVIAVIVGVLAGYIAAILVYASRDRPLLSDKPAKVRRMYSDGPQLDEFEELWHK